MTPPKDIPTRQFLASLADWPKAEVILDLGCGDGHDLREMARRASPDALLAGIDGAQAAIEAAREASRDDARFTYLAADVTQGLPFEDGSFDIVYSNNLLECIVDKNALIAEMRRVLRPGGRVLCAHYDWDSQMIDGVDKDAVRRLVHAFADWKQAWMADSDGWMGRRLWSAFEQTGLFDGEVRTFVLTETEFTPNRYGWSTIDSFRALVKRGLASQDDFDRVYEGVERLAGEGRYLYSIVMFAYAGSPKPG